jgi:hypothetical protein
VWIKIPQNVKQILPIICYKIQTAHVVVSVKWGMVGGVADISKTDFLSLFLYVS